MKKARRVKGIWSNGADYNQPYNHSARTWLLTRRALLLARPLGALCALFGLVVILGYLSDFEPLYRPLSGGPATNPLTATCFTLIGLGIAIGSSGYSKWLQRLLALAAMVAASLRLIDAWFDTVIANAITPFQTTVVADILADKPNAMGVNSATLLCLLALAVVFHSLRRPLVAQMLSFSALGLPVISLTGYAYGLENFYGQMSLVTVTVGLFLSGALLATTAHRGVLRAVLSPYLGGRIARMQILLGYIVPFLMGYLLVKTLLISGGENMFGIFVVSVSWFIILLICFSAIVQERVDHKRRLAERALAIAAMNDPLTQLPNRRKFFDVGRHEMARLRRTGNELWGLMIDIDHFKKINDTAGHAMGDQVLVSLSRNISESVRSVDIVGRLGGEEFAVLLVDTSRTGAIRVAESIRKKIEAMSVQGWTDRYGSITVSIGCASSQHKHTLDELLADADRTLYLAKRQGRNRVVLSDTDNSGRIEKEKIRDSYIGLKEQGGMLFT